MNLQSFSEVSIVHGLTLTGHGHEIREGLAEAVRSSHAAQVKAGWWTDLETGNRKERDWQELFALMHSELSEALEADRKKLMDDKLPHRPGQEVEVADLCIRLFDFLGSLGPAAPGTFANCVMDRMHVKDQLEDTENFGRCISALHARVSMTGYFFETNPDDSFKSAAALFFGVFVVCKRRDFDLAGSFIEKARYNAKREDHKLETRKKEGGKAY